MFDGSNVVDMDFVSWLGVRVEETRKVGWGGIQGR